MTRRDVDDLALLAALAFVAWLNRPVRVRRMSAPTEGDDFRPPDEPDDVPWRKEVKLPEPIEDADPGDETPEPGKALMRLPNGLAKILNGCPRCGQAILYRRRDGAKWCVSEQIAFFPTLDEVS